MAFNDRLRTGLVKSTLAGRPLTVGIVGGGATGVELAAELIQIAGVIEQYGITRASEHLKVVLIEAGPRLLGTFPDRVGTAAQTKLEQLGVIVRTDARVSSVEESGFHLNSNEHLPVDLKVWAAGVKAPALLDTLTDLERTRNGQLVVGPSFAAPGDFHIYAVGDCASPRLPGLEGPEPTTAQAASQHARYLCRYLPALIAGKPAPPARYHDFGALVSLGGYDAFGTLGRFGFFDGGFLKGRVAQLGHAMLYRTYQARLHGAGRGTLIWLVDMINRRVRPAARLS